MTLFPRQSLIPAIFIILLELVPVGLSAQKLKLSKERKATLDDIANRQQTQWQNNRRNGRTFQDFMDSIKTANPKEYRKMLEMKGLRVKAWEEKALLAKKQNMDKYEADLAEPGSLYPDSLELKNALFEEIPEKVFEMNELMSLDISDNKIQNVTVETFSGLQLQN
jgi:hypothetical protein